MLGAGVWCVNFPKWMGKPLPGRWVFGIVLLGLAGLFATQTALDEPQRITISNDAMSYADHFGKGILPRKGLTVTETMMEHKRSDIRSWSSWTIDPDNAGLGFAGFDIYWGPNGLIRGDALGQRIANWAGTKPQHRHSSDSVQASN
jgi:hypothetical protein